MDFRNAMSASTAQQRDDLVRAEIENESWCDYLDEHTTRGGYVEDACPETITIDEDDKALFAKVFLSFTESVPTSCNEMNVPFDGTANITIEIDKESGDYDYEVESSGSSYDDEDEPEFFVNDYL